MKVCMPSNARPADDIRIMEKETRSLSGPGYRAMPRGILAKLRPKRIFARRKNHDGEIFFQRANA